MIFSLFKKKGGRDKVPRSASGPDAPPSPAPARAREGEDRPADARALARQTAAKIDEIESEMIVVPRTAVPLQTGLAGSVYLPKGQGATTTVRPEPSATRARPTRSSERPAAPTGLTLAPLDEPVVSFAYGGIDVDESEEAPRFELASEEETFEPDSGLAIAVSQPLMHAPPPADAPALPPPLEEAAVLYSNGQDEAAVGVLRQSIDDNLLGPHTARAWVMLFDLYQSTGCKEDFENLAFDYSSRFEASPPTWNPVLAPLPAQAVSAALPPTVNLGTTLDARSARQLDPLPRLAKRHRWVRLDVSSIRQIDPAGAALLLRAVRTLTQEGASLRIEGAAALSERLTTCIESGRRDASDACWMLQLEMLRILDRQSDFDDLAIDYCVTYEVSPPSWEPMPASIQPDIPDDPASTTLMPGTEISHVARADAFELMGEVTGRAQQALQALSEYAVDRAEVVIDCHRLRRVDFVAAGELLNEIGGLRTGGKYVIFQDVNHIVGALLAVMGIPDLAEVRLRRY